MILVAASLLVQPFLQSVGPDGAWVVWEADTDGPAQVRWGWQGLDHISPAAVAWGDGGSVILEAHLDGIPPGQSVTYEVHHGDVVSGPWTFRTARDPDTTTSVRLVAVSDMQRSDADPSKWGEIVHDGLVDWLTAAYGPDLSAVLDGVLLPGDLVDDGNEHDDWTRDFFGLSHPLGAQVPLWPVLGNHEQDADWYFRYFHLPDNGSPSRETGAEHWWTHRLANVRIVGLDSNGTWIASAQLTWLDLQLDLACDEPGVDFLFVQLHHPARSELWVPGNHPWATLVDLRLDDFAARCDKPAVTFFGHTHGYARGQAPEDSHLMINVASAGGALDRWAEQVQTNEPAFSVSDDTWGWVLIEAEAGPEPSLLIRRLSRGDREVPLDNVEIDRVQLRRYDLPPAAPTPLAPWGGESPSDCVTLQAGPFTDPEGDAHQATQWQVSQSCDFGLIHADVWRQDRDLYFGVDTQAGDDLTDEQLRALPPGPACWRVRYRDDRLGWSSWSTPIGFTLAPRQRTPQLLEDRDGESGRLLAWQVTGAVEVTGDTRCGAPAPAAGARAIGLGGPCGEGAGSMVQSVRLPADLPGRVVHASAWLAGGARLRLRFRDASGTEVGSAISDVADQGWTWVEIDPMLPEGTARIEVELSAELTGYADDVSLTVGTGAPLDCMPRRRPAEDPALPVRRGCDGISPNGLLWPVLGLLLLRRRAAAR